MYIWLQLLVNWRELKSDQRLKKGVEYFFKKTEMKR